MMHIMDHHVNEIFNWNCEGQWEQLKDHYLPSRAGDDILLLKPDLAVSFSWVLSPIT